jgi:hypothetical protein
VNSPAVDGTAAVAFIPDRADPLDPLVSSFPPATPELLGRRALLSRVDSKYVVPIAHLEHVLAGLAAHYAVLRVESGSVATYDNLYFDTPQLRCYHDHGRGRRIRHKVRIRHYPDRQLSFLEVKTKRNEAVTDKHRMPVAYGNERLGLAELDFLRMRIGEMADDLQPAIAMTYRRLSLIGLASDERVTIDLGLSASGEHGAIVARTLGHLAVIEIKQWPYCVRTPIMRAVRGNGHREMSMSKYITAMSLIRPELRRNRFLPALRALERI